MSTPTHRIDFVELRGSRAPESVGALLEQAAARALGRDLTDSDADLLAGLAALCEGAARQEYRSKVDTHLTALVRRGHRESALATGDWCARAAGVTHIDGEVLPHGFRTESRDGDVRHIVFRLDQKPTRAHDFARPIGATE